MTTPNKKQVVALAMEMYCKDQTRKGCTVESLPEVYELLEEGYLEKAKEHLETTDQIRHNLKQWESYSKSFNSKQSSTKKLKDETCISTSMSIPFNLDEARDTGFFACGTSQSGKTTLCKHIVKKIVDTGLSVYVIDVSKAWTVDTPISNVIKIPNNIVEFNIPSNTSTIIDISDMGFRERFKFVNAFTRTIYNWHKSKGYKKAPFEFVFYEEAHTYLPNGCFRAAEKYSAIIDLVTVGANFNLRFGAITQFPAALDKGVVKITQQRYFGWTTEYNDRNYVKSFVGKEDVDPKNPDSIFNLQKGQFLYQLRNKITKIQSSPYTDTTRTANNYVLNNQQLQMNNQQVNMTYNLSDGQKTEITQRPNHEWTPSQIGDHI